MAAGAVSFRFKVNSDFPRCSWDFPPLAPNRDNNYFSDAARRSVKSNTYIVLTARSVTIIGRM